LLTVDGKGKNDHELFQKADFTIQKSAITNHHIVVLFIQQVYIQPNLLVHCTSVLLVFYTTCIHNYVSSRDS